MDNAEALKLSPITDTHAHDVCKIGQGASCCRYLTMGTAGWSCERSSLLAEEVDRRVAAGLFTAKAINCEGRLSR